MTRKKNNLNCQIVNTEKWTIFKSFSHFHMNVCSLDDFKILLNGLNVKFDILAIAESYIRKDSSVGGTLLYINKRLSYQGMT